MLVACGLLLPALPNLGLAVPVRTASRSILVVDAEASVAGFELAGEAATARIDMTDALAGINASAQRGMYVEAIRPFGRGLVRTMPGSSFTSH